MISKAGAWKSLYQDFRSSYYFQKYKVIPLKKRGEKKKKKERNNPSALISLLQSFTFCFLSPSPSTLPAPRKPAGGSAWCWPAQRDITARAGSLCQHHKALDSKSLTETWCKTHPKAALFCAEPSCDSHVLASFGELCKEDSSHVQALCTSSASHAAPRSAFYFLTLGVDKEGRGLTQHSLRAPPCCSIPERCRAGTAAPPGLVPAAGGGERLGCPQLQSQLCLGGYPAVGSPKPFLIRTSSGTTTDSTLGSATAWPLGPLFAQEPPTSPISSHCPPCIVWGRGTVWVGRRLDPTIDGPRAPGDMAGR